jgi:hypothetical protein
MIPASFVVAAIIIIFLGCAATIFIHPFCFFLIPVAIIGQAWYGIKKGWL